MPLTPIPNVGSQIDRALVAYLVYVGATSSESTYPAHRNDEKDADHVVVKAQSSQHDPQNTGNESFMVQIQVKFSAAHSDGEAHVESRRIAIDRAAGLIMAAMLQSDDGQTLKATADAITVAGRALAESDPESNYDMADFTVLDVQYMGAVRGKPDDDAAAWVEIRNFKITACPSNVD